MRPLTVLGQTSKFGVQVKVKGGGVTGWAGAISHGAGLDEFALGAKPLTDAEAA